MGIFHCSRLRRCTLYFVLACWNIAPSQLVDVPSKATLTRTRWHSVFPTLTIKQWVWNSMCLRIREMQDHDILERQRWAKTAHFSWDRDTLVKQKFSSVVIYGYNTFAVLGKRSIPELVQWKIGSKQSYIPDGNNGNTCFMYVLPSTNALNQPSGIIPT